MARKKVDDADEVKKDEVVQPLNETQENATPKVHDSVARGLEAQRQYKEGKKVSKPETASALINRFMQKRQVRVTVDPKDTAEPLTKEERTKRMKDAGIEVKEEVRMSRPNRRRGW